MVLRFEALFGLQILTLGCPFLRIALEEVVV